MPATMVRDQKHVVVANIRVPLPTCVLDLFRKKNVALVEWSSGGGRARYFGG